MMHENREKFCSVYSCGRLDSLFGVATRMRAGRSGVRIPAEGKDLVL
jgi:hypothetical protein